VENKSGGTIRIDGWTIETKLEKIVIPQAIDKLKYPFSVKDHSILDLSPNEKTVIPVGLSPLGVNFRINQCTGYLARSSSFFSLFLLNGL
jgi:hypothetical protein